VSRVFKLGGTNDLWMNWLWKLEPLSVRILALELSCTSYWRDFITPMVAIANSSKDYRLFWAS
jgi:hypothetical protein